MPAPPRDRHVRAALASCHLDVCTDTISSVPFFGRFCRIFYIGVILLTSLQSVLAEPPHRVGWCGKSNSCLVLIWGENIRLEQFGVTLTALFVWTCFTTLGKSSVPSFLRVVYLKIHSRYWVLHGACPAPVESRAPFLPVNIVTPSDGGSSVKPALHPLGKPHLVVMH